MKTDWAKHAPTLELQAALWKSSYKDVFRLYRLLLDESKPLISEALLAELDLFFLLVYVLGRKDANQVFVYERCRQVEQEPDGCIDLWARGHYKTSISNALIIQDILKDPNISIGVFSNVQDIAIASIREVKNNLEKNETLKRLYPQILYSKPLTMKSIQWNTTALTVKRTTNRKEPTLECSGLMEGTPVGRHYDLLVYDDIVVPRSVATSDQIKKTTDAFYLSLSMGTKNARRRIYGTRYHWADTYSELIDKGAYKLRQIPATCDGTLSGEPVFFTEKEWDRLVAETQSKDIACQYLLNPSLATEKVFDPNDLQVFQIRPARMDVFILCDPARSRNAAACDTAMVVLGLTRSRSLFLLDGRCHKMNLAERWHHLATLMRRWSAEPGILSLKIGYESIGNDDIEFFNEQMKGSPERWHIEPLTRSITGPNQKAARIERIGPDLKGHRLHVPYDGAQGFTSAEQLDAIRSGQRWLLPHPILVKGPEGRYDVTSLLKEQLRDYPVGRRIDLLDALSRFYDMASNKSGGASDKWGRSLVVPRERFGVMAPHAMAPHSGSEQHPLNPVIHGRSGRWNRHKQSGPVR